MNTMTCATDDELDVLLARLNENGITPVVLGFDAHGNPFLAYGWAPGGDGWDCGVTFDNPRDTEGDVWDKATGKSHPRCEECAAYQEFGLDTLSYPVEVFHRVELPTESDSYPAGYPND